MKNFAVVVAATASTWGIGKGGGIPWKLAEDIKFFKTLTTTVAQSEVSMTRNAVIMGRKTYESIPKKFRPLSDRLNVIVSGNPNLRRDLNIPDDVLIATSLLEALKTLSFEKTVDSIFVIGGESLYRESIGLKECNKIYLTSIEAPNFEVSTLDTFFPVIPASSYRLSYRSHALVESGVTYRFTEYDALPSDIAIVESTASVRHRLYSSGGKLLSPMHPTASVPNFEEQQYLDLAAQIIRTGALRMDRTGTGTKSVFGAQMRFSLRDGVFPLLTTKKVFWRGVAEELLWFIKGKWRQSNINCDCWCAKLIVIFFVGFDIDTDCLVPVD
jgi:dihydrofolate reductase/thymidylate synthase